MTGAFKYLGLRPPLRDLTSFVSADRGVGHNPLGCIRARLRGEGVGLEPDQQNFIEAGTVFHDPCSGVSRIDDHWRSADKQI